MPSRTAIASSSHLALVSFGSGLSGSGSCRSWRCMRRTYSITSSARREDVLAQIIQHLADGDDAVAIAMPNDPSAARHPLKRGVLDDHQIVNRLLLQQAAGTVEDRFAPADQTVPPREVLRRGRHELEMDERRP